MPGVNVGSPSSSAASIGATLTPSGGATSTRMTYPTMRRPAKRTRTRAPGVTRGRALSGALYVHPRAVAFGSTTSM